MKLSLKQKISLALVATLVLFTAAFVLVLTTGKATAERHSPYDYPDSFDYQSAASFSDYINWSQQHLRAGRTDLADTGIINKLSPFRLDPEASCPLSSSGKILNGVVLTHELMDSPYTMRALAQHLNQRCFLVFGLLLPGHGTRPGDLLTSNWQA